jgi:hypothetical protein
VKKAWGSIQRRHHKEAHFWTTSACTMLGVLNVVFHLHCSWWREGVEGVNPTALSPPLFLIAEEIG